LWPLPEPTAVWLYSPQDPSTSDDPDSVDAESLDLDPDEQRLMRIREEVTSMSENVVTTLSMVFNIDISMSDAKKHTDAITTTLGMPCSEEDRAQERERFRGELIIGLTVDLRILRRDLAEMETRSRLHDETWEGDMQQLLRRAREEWARYVRDLAELRSRIAETLGEGAVAQCPLQDQAAESLPTAGSLRGGGDDEAEPSDDQPEPPSEEMAPSSENNLVAEILERVVDGQTSNAEFT